MAEQQKSKEISLLGLPITKVLRLAGVRVKVNNRMLMVDVLSEKGEVEKVFEPLILDEFGDPHRAVFKRLSHKFGLEFEQLANPGFSTSSFFKRLEEHDYPGICEINFEEKPTVRTDSFSEAMAKIVAGEEPEAVKCVLQSEKDVIMTLRPSAVEHELDTWLLLLVNKKNPVESMYWGLCDVLEDAMGWDQKEIQRKIAVLHSNPGQILAQSAQEKFDVQVKASMTALGAVFPDASSKASSECSFALEEVDCVELARNLHKKFYAADRDRKLISQYTQEMEVAEAFQLFDPEEIPLVVGKAQQPSFRHAVTQTLRTIQGKDYDQILQLICDVVSTTVQFRGDSRDYCMKASVGLFHLRRAQFKCTGSGNHDVCRFYYKA